jgi:hypothetical protein
MKMKKILQVEYQTAKNVLEDFMGMVAGSVPWPLKGLIRPFTDQFMAMLDGLHAEQVCLLEALERKDARLRELESGDAAAEGWAELEEI